MTCALAPPSPNEFTLILSDRWFGQGTGSVGTVRRASSQGTIQIVSYVALFVMGNLLFGLGVSNLMLGSIVLCSRDSTAFIKLVRPDAPSECPTFGLTLEIIRESLLDGIISIPSQCKLHFDRKF